MSTTRFLTSGWHWDVPGLALCSAALIGATAFLFWHRGRARSGNGTLGAALAIWSGAGLLVLALLSPLATLARQYLFSAHMAQHILLLLAIPGLVLLGLSRAQVPLRGGAAKLSRWLGTSPAGWVAGVGAMWFWHVPRLCDAAATNTTVYYLQAGTLLVFGAMFWCPILGPRAEHRLSPLAGIAYLVSACFACTLLGIYVTFAPTSICPVFVHPTDPAGVLTLVRDTWGMSPQTDQAVGGLMMWVPGCLVYLAGVIGLLARWYGSAVPHESPAGQSGKFSKPA